MVILNRDKHVFVGQRYDMSRLQTIIDAWQMPQGGIDSDETPLEAAFREMKEEIGTTQVQLIAESQNWLHYDFPKELASTLWGGRFDGQQQKWFLFQFLGNDSDVNLNTKHPEFSEWRWVPPEILPDIIVPFKKNVYKQVLEEFKNYLS